MSKAVSTERWLGRFLVFSAIFLLPFTRFLLQNEYGLLHVEVGALLAVIGCACALLALVARPRAAFLVLALGSVLVMSENTLSILLHGAVRARWILPGLAALLIAGYLLLRERLFQLVLIFSFGAFAVDLGERYIGGGKPAQNVIASSPVASDAAHVIHVIFDEHLGLAGFPEDIPECRRARDHLASVLMKHGFEIYPEAFSNYRNTKFSIPSILDHELLHHNAQFYAPEQFYTSDSTTLNHNRLFEELQKTGYGLRVYESDYLNFCPPQLKCSSVKYKANSIGKLQEIPMGWREKFKHIAISFIQSDGFLTGLLRRPFPSLDTTLTVGPFCVTDIWPDRLARDIRNTTSKTYFFAHLVVPHYPYVYKRDGTVRPHSTWHEFPLVTLDPQAHRISYERYGEQVEFLSTQMDHFLTELEKSPLYEKSTIIFHGDHGSRLRLLTGPDAQHRKELEDSGRGDEYDYPSSPPPLRDLLDRFSALCAVKRPGSHQGSIVKRKTSVMRIVAETLDSAEAAGLPPAIDNVYLFDKQNQPRAIPVISIWNSETNGNAAGASQQTRNYPRVR